MKKKFILIYFVVAAALVSSCEGKWDEHYTANEPSKDWGTKPEQLPTLFSTISQNADQYSYILSLFDTEECSILNEYLKQYGDYSIVLFTDTQFDEAVSSVSPDFEAAVAANENLKAELIKSTFTRNCIVGKRSDINSNDNLLSFDGKNVSLSDIVKVQELDNGLVYAYNSELELLALDIFSFTIQPETWPNYSMGGGSSRKTVIVPQTENGNGSASWFNGNNTHLFMKIGGTANGKTYYWLNGFTYKITVGVGLYRSTKLALWTHAAAGADQKMVMTDSPLFDESGDFVNATYDGGMTELYFELPLYARENKNQAVKFHIDFRSRTAPDVDGITPATEQKGFVVDYIIYEPIFN